jgi:NADPH:quinone reductase-like Zn-dependent oxidoreductase
MPTVEELRSRGEIGGRTVQIAADGSVECVVYEPAPLPQDAVRIRTVRSAVSPGTESTYLGRAASNVHLSKRWNAKLRIFEPGRPSVSHPIAFGYRAAGIVEETRSPAVPIGTRIWGNWRHTELVAMTATQAQEQRLPDDLDWDDGVDIGQMGPICVNAVAFGAGEQRDRPAVVFGAGPIGLITAQIVRTSGAARVIVVDRLAARLTVAERLGLEVLHAADGVDVAATLKRRFGAEGVPVAWECSGALPALNEAVRSVARRGTVVAVGFYQGGAAALLLGEEFHHNGVRIVCAQIGNPHGSLTRSDLQRRTLELARGGELVLGGLPRLTVPVERAASGFEALGRPDDVLQVGLDYAIAA